MPSRRFAAKYGAIRFLSCPGRAETVSKFRAVSGNAWRTPSPSPPKSAKVKLSRVNQISRLYGVFKICLRERAGQRRARPAPASPRSGIRENGIGEVGQQAA